MKQKRQAYCWKPDVWFSDTYCTVIQIQLKKTTNLLISVGTWVEMLIEPDLLASLSRSWSGSSWCSIDWLPIFVEECPVEFGRPESLDRVDRIPNVWLPNNAEFRTHGSSEFGWKFLHTFKLNATRSNAIYVLDHVRTGNLPFGNGTAVQYRTSGNGTDYTCLKTEPVGIQTFTL